MNKTILITGGAIRIGKAICEKFHKEGVKVLGTGTYEEKLNKLKSNFSEMIFNNFDEYELGFTIFVNISFGNP